MTSKQFTEFQIREIVLEIVGDLAPNETIGEDTDIFESGIANSLLALQIINRLESSFYFEVDEEDLERENFATINGMIRFVLGKVPQTCAMTA